jgi:hypothetical protein
MKPTKEQVKAVIQATMAISDAIRELKQVPSGKLYAIVMGKMSLEDYNAIIETLKRIGVVEEINHLLVWVGPAANPQRMYPSNTTEQLVEQVEKLPDGETKTKIQQEIDNRMAGISKPRITPQVPTQAFPKGRW